MANDYFTREQAFSYLGKSYAIGRNLYIHDAHPGVLFKKGELFLVTTVFYDGKGYLVTLSDSLTGSCCGPIGYQQFLRVLRQTPFLESSTPAPPPIDSYPDECQNTEVWLYPAEIDPPDFDAWVTPGSKMQMMSDSELLKFPETRGDYLSPLKAS